jgi:citrate lyase beta subunit
MSKTTLTEGDEGVRLIIKDQKEKVSPATISARTPVHVVYGGADRFSADTPRKLGRIALDSLKAFAPNFAAFATAFQLHGYQHLPTFPRAVKELEASLKAAPDKIKKKDRAAWFAWTVHQKTLAKLRTEPVEDFRIDFEDGYGFRSEEEEDGHAVSAATELAAAFKKRKTTAFAGFRIKSLAPGTYGRAIRTLELFLATLLDQTDRKLLDGFVVTLPKVTDAKQVKDLARRLSKIEKDRKIAKDSIGIELMIETPDAIFDKRGRAAVPSLIKASRGRCRSFHFGAYDYTAALGISASFQDIRHPACSFARSVIQAACAGSGVRVVDSVTTQIPVPVHRDEILTEAQTAENRRSVHAGWLKHFQNVSASMADGFYQSWDLHPNQLVARYAAVYGFFLTEMDAQAARLKTFLGKATQASLTGNTFDDAASAQGIVNFFRNGFDCGAFGDEEIKQAIGLTSADLRASFSELASARRSKVSSNANAAARRTAGG